MKNLIFTLFIILSLPSIAQEAQKDTLAKQVEAQGFCDITDILHDSLKINYLYFDHLYKYIPRGLLNEAFINTYSLRIFAKISLNCNENGNNLEIAFFRMSGTEIENKEVKQKLEKQLQEYILSFGNFISHDKVQDKDCLSFSFQTVLRRCR